MSKYDKNCIGLTPEEEFINHFLEFDEPSNLSLPQEFSCYFIDFTKAFRNESVMCDFSIKEIGRVGYLYIPRQRGEFWEYDIIIHPSRSGKAVNFEKIKIAITTDLCRLLPLYEKWVTMPESLKSRRLQLYRQLCM